MAVPASPIFVDGVGEQRHAVRNEYDGQLQSRRRCQNQERPLDRPNTSGSGGDARVNDAVGVAVGAVVIVPAMTVPVVMRAEAQPIFHDQLLPRYRHLLMSLQNKSKGERHFSMHF